MKRFFAFLVLIVTILAFTGVSFAQDGAFPTRPHSWTDTQRFRGNVEFNSLNDKREQQVEFGANSETSFKSGAEFDIESGATADFKAGSIVEFNTGYPDYMTTKVFPTNYTNGTGFTITSPTTNGKIVRIDLTGVTDYGGTNGGSTLGVARTGTTVVLPTVTEFMDGWELTIIKVDSGTSEVVPYSSVPLGNASGTTPGANVTTYLLNAQGDSVTLIADYNSSVSWWIKSAVIH
jgi:hypothetical protein